MGDSCPSSGWIVHRLNDHSGNDYWCYHLPHELHVSLLMSASHGSCVMEIIYHPPLKYEETGAQRGQMSSLGSQSPCRTESVFGQRHIEPKAVPSTITLPFQTEPRKARYSEESSGWEHE